MAIKKYKKALVYLNVSPVDDVEFKGDTSFSESDDSDSEDTPKTKVEANSAEKQKEVTEHEVAIFLNMSMAYLNNKNNPDAEKSARRALKADPQNVKGMK